MSASLQSSAHFEKSSFNGNSVVTVGFTVPAGTNQRLVVKWSGDKFENFATGSFAWNGVAMTLLGTTVGTSVNKVQAWYINNPAQGTFNFTNTTGDQHNLGSYELELWQDVDLGTAPTFTVQDNTGASSITSSATVAAGFVASMTITGNFGTTTPVSTTDIFTNIATYSGMTSTSGYRAGGAPGWTWTGSLQVGALTVVQKDAVTSGLTGSATLGDITASGSIDSVASSMTGNATLGDIAASGSMAPQPGTFTSSTLKNAPGAILANTTIPKLAFIRLNDMSSLLTLLNQTTDGAGVLSISSSALIPGTAVILLMSSADGLSLGAETKVVT